MSCGPVCGVSLVPVRKTQLRRLAVLVVGKHVSLDHQSEVRALLVQLARVVARAIESLLLACEGDELDVLAELETLARDDTGDTEECGRAGTVVVTAGRADAPERPTAVVVRADEDRLRRVLRAFVRAASQPEISSSTTHTIHRALR